MAFVPLHDLLLMTALLCGLNLLLWLKLALAAQVGRWLSQGWVAKLDTLRGWLGWSAAALAFASVLLAYVAVLVW
ncbi:hypothetical protein CK507_01235 [Pseudomonas sp. WN033]|nr:hypothetical protein CK507_01235 [Pseudomonas sp. WN033]